MSSKYVKFDSTERRDTQVILLYMTLYKLYI